MIFNLNLLPTHKMKVSINLTFLFLIFILFYSVLSLKTSPEKFHIKTSDTIQSNQVISGPGSSYMLPYVSIKEMTVLQNFYYAMNGQSWVYPMNISASSRWTFIGKFDNYSSPCQQLWYGVSCLCTSFECHVIGISLPSSNLRGNLHNVGITGLTMLQTLQLSKNLINGTIPILLMNVKDLDLLDLSGNQLTGTIPAFSSLSNISNLDLSSNFLRGTMSFVFNATRLNHLSLSNNFFSGTIPAAVIRNTGLVNLQLGNNNLHGPIPFEIGSFQLLQTLNLSYNILSGPLPPSIGGLRSLISLDISLNYMSSSLPSTLGGLASVRDLRFDRNSLTGILPSSLNSLANLQVLLLQNNLFKKQNLYNFLSLSTQTALQVLDISNNQFSGSLPNHIFQFPSLAVFEAAANCFGGTLPQEVCYASNLQVLGLDGISSSVGCRVVYFKAFEQYGLETYGISKSITGEIPSCLFNLPALQSLHLVGNGLQGPLPHDLVVGSLLQDLDLSHNRLNGTIPLAIQDRVWKKLDLSYNRFRGQLSKHLAVSSSPNASLSLRVNRLSGPLPSTLTAGAQISVLEGNLFSCGMIESNLPPQDPAAGTYQCGSNSFLAAFYTFVSFVGVTVIVVVILLIIWASMQNCACCVVSASTKKFFDRFSRWTEAFQEPVDELEDAVDGVQAFDGDIEEVSNTVVFGKLMTDIRILTFVIAAFLFVVLLPTYQVLSVFCSTHDVTEAWSISAAFLSGETPAIILFFLLTAFQVTLVAAYNTIIHGRYKNEEDVILLAQHRDSWTQYFFFAVVGALDVVIIVFANVLYIYGSETYSPTEVVFIQIFFSIFKVGWNSVGIKVLLAGVRVVIDFCGITKKDYMQGEIIFLSFIGIFNNILVPCMATAAVNQECYAAMLNNPPKVVEQYSYDVCIQAGNGTGCEVSGESVDFSAFNPPFLYSFQCTSALLTNYSAVFVYMYIITAFVVPAVTITASWRMRYIGKESTIYRLLSMALPPLLQPLPDITPEPIPEIFDLEGFVVRNITVMAVMITFGAMFPLVAFVISVSITSDTILTQLFARKKRLDSYLAAIEEQCEDVSESLIKSVWLLIPFAAPFYGFFLFDMVGDTDGAITALWAPICIISIFPIMPFGFDIVTYVKLRRIESKRATSKTMLGARLDSINSMVDATVEYPHDIEVDLGGGSGHLQQRIQNQDEDQLADGSHRQNQDQHIGGSYWLAEERSGGWVESSVTTGIENDMECDGGEIDDIAFHVLDIHDANEHVDAMAVRDVEKIANAD